MSACVGSGFCCKRAPCVYGAAGPDGACTSLVPWLGDDLGVQRYRCGKYDEIAADPSSVISPAFGAGCCSTLFNEPREQILVALRRRALEAP
jgi:hypothetical protein